MTYLAAHERLYRERGRAAEHPCLACGEPAAEWSYRGGSPAEQKSPEGWPYTADVTSYDPLCRSCHRKFDGAGSSILGTLLSARMDFSEEFAEALRENRRSVMKKRWEDPVFRAKMTEVGHRVGTKNLKRG